MSHISGIVKPKSYPLLRDNTPRTVDKVEFGIFSKSDIDRISHIEVLSSDLYNYTTTKEAVPYGPLDRRLGCAEKNALCETCNKKMEECVGHFGVIKLSLPIFHYGFFKGTLAILQCICKGCSRVMIDEQSKKRYLRRYRTVDLEMTTKMKIFKDIQSKCKKVSICMYCNYVNGTVKKIGAMKIVHVKFSKVPNSDTSMDEYIGEMSSVLHVNESLKSYITKCEEDVNPLLTYRLFEKMSDDDTELMGLNPKVSRPENLVLTFFPVPPNQTRPSVAQDDKTSNEDDLTIKLKEMIMINSVIRVAIIEGQPINKIMDQWDTLQTAAALFINAELPGFNAANSSLRKPARGIVQRLKGKQGRFRNNLCGKRVDFSGRTVISPDPNMRIDQLAVPKLIAMNLTFPERVDNQNINKLRKLIRNGPNHHPGASYVTSGKLKISLKYGDRQKAADGLKINDIVERHLMDDDVALFNRQPSLHRVSMMAHKIVVLPWRTLRFNECVCSPYNADFDGDEMNIHVPQTLEAKAEALLLMGVQHNLCTPKNGENLIAATQDFITCSYLLSQKDVFFSKPEISQICGYMDCNLIQIDLPKPAIIKPVRLWTGKQIFSILLRPSHSSNVLVNLECKTKSYTKCNPKELCPQDGWLIIYNSTVVCGVFDKNVVGDGNKDSIFYVILRDFGANQAAECMNRLSKLSARYMGERGFSIGINDVWADVALQQQKHDLVEQGYSKCRLKIEEYKDNKLDTQAGCSEEETLENVLSGILSNIREEAGQLCLNELNRYNSPIIMSRCGSKGSKLNVAQMVSCVGQQIVNGKRIPDSFDSRPLPHFPRNDKSPPSKGFVRNSFFSGLSPSEFIFHAASGREGLVDTAVKTATTGYLARRLMKTMEDLCVGYDYTVRTPIGNIIQFQYGDDKMDPLSMEGDGKPVEFHRNLLNVLHDPNLKSNPLSSNQIYQLAVQETSSAYWAKNCDMMFITDLLGFIKEHICDKISSIYRCTETELIAFLKICFTKYVKSKIEPGTACGAIGAQGLSEPGTQMTLKTFHFAGIATMSITLGVPRLNEIINASKSISTPIIKAALVSNKSEVSARIVKGRIEKTLLSEICNYIEEVYKPGECFIEMQVDIDTINKLQLEITANDLVRFLVQSKLKLSQDQINIYKNKLRIYTRKDGLDTSYHLKELKRKIGNICISGLPDINRAVISENGDKLELLVEGNGFQQVMNIDGIVGTETTCNNIIEVGKVLGIEAARSTIIKEIQYTLGQHGLSVDPRHVMLLGDVMCSKGEVLGVTRFGLGKMKDSALMLASFEKTDEQLINASLFSKCDSTKGVSEAVVLGKPATIGTGMFNILRDVKPKKVKASTKFLFED
eukprot:NODE_104_length_19952_cov_0.449000.p1 type:complete len:1361 gc:universal NODE_104_length_19952_cov_0.449000:14372-18454(+)